MKLNKDCDIHKINCDDFTQVDLFDYKSEDLFEVQDYFWACYQDTIAKNNDLRQHDLFCFRFRIQCV